MILDKQTKKTKVTPFNTHEPKNVIERFFSNQKVIAVLALAFLIFLLFPLTKSYSRRLVAEKEIKEMKSRIAKFENDNKELVELLDYLSSPQAAEDQGRMSLNLKKQGEAMVIIDRKEISELERKILEEESNSNAWKLWWNYFFN